MSNKFTNEAAYDAHRLATSPWKLGEAPDSIFTEAIQELIRKHHLASEALTEQQLAEVIRQALASGDLVKYVRVRDNGQQIVYAPFMEVERLRSQLEELQEERRRVVPFISEVTLGLQSYRSLSADQFKHLFDEAYTLYCLMDVEGRNTNE